MRPLSSVVERVSEATHPIAVSFLFSFTQLLIELATLEQAGTHGKRHEARDLHPRPAVDAAQPVHHRWPSSLLNAATTASNSLMRRPLARESSSSSLHRS